MEQVTLEQIYPAGSNAGSDQRSPATEAGPENKKAKQPDGESLDYETALERAAQNGTSVERETRAADALAKYDPAKVVPGLREVDAEIAAAKKRIQDAVKRRGLVLPLQTEWENKVAAHESFAHEVSRVKSWLEFAREFAPKEKERISTALSIVDGPQQFIGLMGRLLAAERMVSFLQDYLAGLESQHEERTGELHALSKKLGVQF